MLFFRGFPFLSLLSLANDTHIFGLTHVIFLTFGRFASQFTFVGLFIQPCKCLTWVHLTYFLGSSPLSSFYYLSDRIRIFGVPFGLASFVSSFL